MDLCSEFLAVQGFLIKFWTSHFQDELLEELEELEQEKLNEELLNMGEDEEIAPATLPDIPSTHLPNSPGTKNSHCLARGTALSTTLAVGRVMSAPPVLRQVVASHGEDPCQGKVGSWYLQLS